MLASKLYKFNKLSFDILQSFELESETHKIMLKKE